ncbi:YebG family protein [Pseudomonas aeruginosa]|uniref:YebG family protein n=1 Tax=Pseudomonas aeruginosa TaxID=287 RepID=UPI000EB5DA7C|nr:YebG family protein [Pseudomonas aeruginosa]
MAVEVLYRSSRDPECLLMNKADAEAHDRMLEVGENLATVFRHVLPSMSEENAETLGIFLSKRRSELVAAIKKDPAAILDLIKPDGATAGTVVPLANAS